MKKLFAVCALLLFPLMTSQVFGYSVSFGDSAIYWPGWSNGTTDDEFRNEVLGTPNITGGTATISTSGYLTGLTFYVNDINPTSEAPGDLFIDSNGDTKWDYVVNLLGKRNSSYIGFAIGDYKLYSLNNPLALNSTTYTLSYVSSGPSEYRENHPVAYNVTSNLTKVSDSIVFSGWVSGGTPTFSFGDTAILLTGSQFTIGWTEQCANDVLYERKNNPIPEPATMLLLGAGLIGLAGYGRRKFKKV